MGETESDLCEYLTWARNVRGLSENTLRVRFDLLIRLRNFLGYSGVLALRDAEPEDLRRFERVAIAGRTPETRRAYACHVRAFYRWALQTGLVEKDPSTVLTIPRIPRHLPRPIEEDQLAAAVCAARPKMAAMLVLAAYAGLRCCEIAGLDWTDFRREPDGSAFVIVRAGKGAKERTVEIGQKVIHALQGYGMRRRGPVFLGEDGQRVRAASVSSSGNRFLARHGIDATMHQLRHRYGTVAYQLSRDLRMVQEQMGHSSPQTTAIYTRASAEAASRMVAAMDALPVPRTPRDHARAGRRPLTQEPTLLPRQRTGGYPYSVR